LAPLPHAQGAEGFGGAVAAAASTFFAPNPAM